MSAEARSALATLPPLGEDSAGPLGSGLLASGILGSIIRQIQTDVTENRRARDRCRDGRL
jgi:hypothetical protein